MKNLIGVLIAILGAVVYFREGSMDGFIIASLGYLMLITKQEKI